MKKYEEPSMRITEVEIEDIITSSNGLEEAIGSGGDIPWQIK